MLKVLITGGSGFIGTNLVESFLQDKIPVLNIDKGKPVNIDHLPYWRQVDILDRVALEKIMFEFDPGIIIHLAAVTDLKGDSLEYYKANIEGTKNIINIAKSLPSLKKVIYTSSMYVCEPGFIPPDFNTYKPHTIYGESKVAGELLVREIKDVNYDWVLVRPTSIWGPWFDIPYIDFFNVVYKRRYFDFGNACTKTYGYVGNTVFQIRQLLLLSRMDSNFFYLGDCPPVQISEWANEISLEMGKGAIKRLPFYLLKSMAFCGDILLTMKVKFPITSFRLKNMTTNNVLPLTNLYDAVGTPPFSRREGIRNTIKWLKDFKGYKL